MQPAEKKSSSVINNFGRNISFSPKHHERPASEEEVLAMMQRHAGRRLRAHGSLHSWSPVAVADDVSVDLSQMNRVRIDVDGGSPTVTVGAGCQIKRLVAELNRCGWTTPTLGLIMEQTIAGATATATHGSGRHCLSHYIGKLRIATYDGQGKPVIQEITGGEELKASRCSLGSMGIVTEVVIPIRKQYFIEEHFCEYEDLNAVLAAEEEYPIQQFFLVPWRWTYLAQHRRETRSKRSCHASLYRAFWTFGMDRAFHWIIIALARWSPDFVTKFAFRSVLAMLVPRKWRVVDRSDRQLTMQHQLFRHIETELFVRQSRLAEMLDFTKWILQCSGGDEVQGRSEWDAAINECGVSTEFARLKGACRHHYPICIRKVQADDGLITMSGSDDDEAWYAISFISYIHPSKRSGFFQFADTLTLLSAHLFSCRPHWGKHHNLSLDILKKLYPHYDKFKEVRDRLDPTDVFLPVWMSD